MLVGGTANLGGLTSASPRRAELWVQRQTAVASRHEGAHASARSAARSTHRHQLFFVVRRLRDFVTHHEQAACGYDCLSIVGLIEAATGQA
jgi:hypothetical protein